MPNELDTNIDVLGCLAPLRRLESLCREMSQQAWLDRSDQERTSNQEEFVRLQQELPSSVFLLVRSRISSARPLVAPVRRAKCSSCYMSVPRGDYGAILVGRRPMLCQHCGVLLFADDEERANAAIKS